jgi:hypothetical protein
MKPPKCFIKDFDRSVAPLSLGWESTATWRQVQSKLGKPERPIDRGGLGITNLDKPWIGMDLPVDDMDMALFSAATKVTVNNGLKARFWTPSWLDGTSPV